MCGVYLHRMRSMEHRKTSDVLQTKGSNEIGKIGEKLACAYLEERGITVAALGSSTLEGHLRHVFEFLVSGELWNHLTDEQIRFIFRPFYPRSLWKHGLDLSRFNQHPPLSFDGHPLRYEDPEEFLERIRQGRYEPAEPNSYLTGVSGFQDADGQEHLIPFDRVSWDFVGWQKDGGGACLVEVKTASPGKRLGRFRPMRDSWKETGMEPFELRKLARVGFVPLLVKVQLQHDSEPDISGDEIAVPEIDAA